MAATLTSAGVIHLTAVLPALLIGAFVLARKKGTPVHRATGWLWVSLMLVVDVSAFFLQRDGYSWIHILALANLVSICAGIVFIRNRKYVAHKACMVGAYLGTAAAGVGVVAPGRFLNILLFGT